MLFVLCRNGFDGDDGVSDEDSSVDGERPITSLVLVKMIIAQILEKRPDLVIKLPGVLNERTVGKLRSFGKAWELLKTILAEVKEHVLLAVWAPINLSIGIIAYRSLSAYRSISDRYR